MMNQESNNESPVEWCARMEREAKTGDDAYVYFQLKETWLNRENKDKGVNVDH